jgi:hypothetical protein
MSSSLGKIRFEDDQILFFSVRRHLQYRNTQDSAWDTESKKMVCNCSSSEKVELATDYGGGIRWSGFACRNCLQITNGATDPYRTEYAESDEDDSGYYSPPIFNVFSPKNGLPDWW